LSERLQKFLARAGIASRRAAEELISAGRVTVNGAKATLGAKVSPGDVVLLDGREVAAREGSAWYVLHKPAGMVTTLTDPQGRPSVGQLIAKLDRRLFPVGRLDFDAEGALLLTDDGETANRLMHPRYQVPRTYLVKVKGEPDDGALKKLCSGVRLEDGPARAQSAERTDDGWVKLVVTEGRQHLVKRMLAAVGHPVTRLFRPTHAGMGLAGLDPGQLRPLTPEEIVQVKALAGDPPAKGQPAMLNKPIKQGPPPVRRSGSPRSTRGGRCRSR
jgi:23S rRNA pseudouridine2605 synthase